MDDLQGIDVERIVQQIQEKVRERQANTLPTAIAHPANEQLTADIAALHSLGNPFRIEFTSHRKVLGRLIILAKAGLRRLLTPLLEQQLAYNTTSARTISQLCVQLQEMHQLQLKEMHRLQILLEGEIRDLGGEIKEREAEIKHLSTEVGALGAQQVALRGEVETVGQRQDAALRALREAVVQQLEALEQQHAQICQALRQSVMEQLESMSQQVQDRMGTTARTSALPGKPSHDGDGRRRQAPVDAISPEHKS